MFEKRDLIIKESFGTVKSKSSKTELNSHHFIQWFECPVVGTVEVWWKEPIVLFIEIFSNRNKLKYCLFN